VQKIWQSPSLTRCCYRQHVLLYTVPPNTTTGMINYSASWFLSQIIWRSDRLNFLHSLTCHTVWNIRL